jgi:hypothetical protein
VNRRSVPYLAARRLSKMVAANVAHAERIPNNMDSQGWALYRVPTKAGTWPLYVLMTPGCYADRWPAVYVAPDPDPLRFKPSLSASVWPSPSRHRILRAFRRAGLYVPGTIDTGPAWWRK